MWYVLKVISLVPFPLFFRLNQSDIAIEPLHKTPADGSPGSSSTCKGAHTAKQRHFTAELAPRRGSQSSLRLGEHAND